MMYFLARLRLPLSVLGVLVFFVSQKYLSQESYSRITTIAGLVLLAFGAVIAIVQRLHVAKSGQKNSKALAHAWDAIWGWPVLLLASSVCYLWLAQATSDSLNPETPVQRILLGVWLVSAILGLSLAVGAEVSFARNSTLREPQRVTKSALSALSLGFLLSAIVGFNYSANHWNKVWDFSYLKSTSVSDATVELFKSEKAKDVRIAAFFAKSNEVRPHVISYLEQLKSKGVSYEEFDKDLNPKEAEEFKVSKNGQLILQKGESRERLEIGVELSQARSVLKKLDQDVQKTLNRLISERKKLYFTRGHGEYTWNSKDTDPMMSLALLETLLRNQNFSTGTLSAVDYTDGKVPTDAAAVIVVGPDAPFVQSETDALSSYLDQGGRLGVFFDPMPAPKQVDVDTDLSNDPLRKMLASYGITFVDQILANDRVFLQASKSDIDKWFTLTNSFLSHESTGNLTKLADREAMLLFRTGFLQIEEDKSDWKKTVTIRGLKETFADTNRNLRFDSNKEKREALTIAVAAAKAVTKANDQELPEPRLIVAADATILSDALIRQRTHAIYLLDTMRWIAGISEVSGIAQSEEDVKIQHTNKENALWFNGSVVLVPFLVLLMGFVATRRSKRRMA